MTSNSMDIFGFILPDGQYSLVTGDKSLIEFNKFLKGRFVWGWSGIDWTKSNYLDREKVHDRSDIGVLLKKLREKYDIGGVYSLWFDNGEAINLITAKLEVLCDMVCYYDKKEDWFCNDYWIFSIEEGFCIEIYHEDIITIAQF